MVFVDSGELEAFDDERILYNIPQGSLIGVTSVMDGVPFACNVRAGRPATVVKIGKASMGDALKTAPRWMLSLVSSLSNRSRQLKQSASRPAYKSPLESFAKFLSVKTGPKPLDTEKTVKEYMWQTRSGKKEVLSALEELLRRKFVKLLPSKDKKPNAQMLTVKPKLLDILVEYLQCEKRNETYPAFGLSRRERASLEVLGLEDSLFTRSREEWLKYLQRTVPNADIIIIIRFVELCIFSEVPDSDKLFLDTETLDRYLCAIHGERNIKGEL